MAIVGHVCLREFTHICREMDRLESQWAFNAQTMHSWRAHSGSVRGIATSSDENTVCLDEWLG